jgi:hypothetical protein
MITEQKIKKGTVRESVNSSLFTPQPRLLCSPGRKHPDAAAFGKAEGRWDESPEQD